MRFDDPRPVEAMRELLLQLVAGIPVVTQIPSEMPATLIRIDYVGGRPTSAITDSPRFGIQVYAPSGPEAERIAGGIKTGLELGHWRGSKTGRGHMLRGWSFESVMSLPDPDRPDYARWQILGRLDISKLH